MRPTVTPKGLIATVVSGFFSAVPTLFLLLYLLYHVFRMWRQGKIIYPITVFYLSLLFWDIIQAIGWILNIRWVQRGEIAADDNICVPQAIIQQLGATGTALSILGMSWCILHDYVIDSSPIMYRWAGAVALGILSLVQVLDILIPSIIFRGAHSYYGVAGYWCWISNGHFVAKVVTEYMWFWVAWIFSFLAAIGYFFSMRYNARLPVGFLWIGFPMQGNKLLRFGLFSLDTRHRGLPKWSFSVYVVTPRHIITLMFPIPIQYLDHYGRDIMTSHNMRADIDSVAPIDYVPSSGNKPHQAIPMAATSSGVTSADAIRDQDDETRSDMTSHNGACRRTNKMFALRLLLFPIFYLVPIGPLSIVRFIQFNHSRGNIASAWPIIVACFYALEGFVDVILFIGAGPAFGIDFSS